MLGFQFSKRASDQRNKLTNWVIFIIMQQVRVPMPKENNQPTSNNIYGVDNTNIEQ